MDHAELNDHLLFSRSDLSSFLACEHLTQLDLAVALWEGHRPSYENSYAELLRRKGEEHEEGFLATLHGAGRRVVEVGLDSSRDFEAGARRTVEAMRAGAEYVYQAVSVRTAGAGSRIFWSAWTGRPRRAPGAGPQTMGPSGA